MRILETSSPSALTVQTFRIRPTSSLLVLCPLNPGILFFSSCCTGIFQGFFLTARSLNFGGGKERSHLRQTPSKARAANIQRATLHVNTASLTLRPPTAPAESSVPHWIPGPDGTMGKNQPHIPPLVGWLYDLILWSFSVLIDFFFREVHPRGSWKIPRRGPIIIVAAPHANQVCGSCARTDKPELTTVFFCCS